HSTPLSLHDALPISALALDNAAYRYELDIFNPGEHLTLAINDEYAPVAAFLDVATVERNPAHVTYVIDPTLDYPALGFVADHARSEEHTSELQSRFD